MMSVNIKQSLDLAANNETLLQQIFSILLRDIPHLKVQLSNAVDQSDYAKLSAIVHKLHGTTCYTSLPKLKLLVVSIQPILTQQSDLLPEAAVKAMLDELEQIRIEIESYLHQTETTNQYSNDRESVGLR
jgi:two-component system sensor histidine kinase BarA